MGREDYGVVKIVIISEHLPPLICLNGAGQGEASVILRLYGLEDSFIILPVVPCYEVSILQTAGLTTSIVIHRAPKAKGSELTLGGAKAIIAPMRY